MELKDDLNDFSYTWNDNPGHYDEETTEDDDDEDDEEEEFDNDEDDEDEDNNEEDDEDDMIDEDDDDDDDDDDEEEDDDDFDESTHPKWEFVLVGKESFTLPQEMCESSDLFHSMLSKEMWKSLPEDIQQHFKSFLPAFPENNEVERNKTIQMLFDHDNIRFGNPLIDFQTNLKNANYRPDVSNMQSMLKKNLYKLYLKKYKWQLFNMVKSVVTAKQKLSESVINSERVKPQVPPPKSHQIRIDHSTKIRYFQELGRIRGNIGESSQSSDDENYPQGLLGLTKQKLRRSSVGPGDNDSSDILLSQRIMGTLAPPSPGKNGFKSSVSKHLGHPINPYQGRERNYQQMLIDHYIKKSRLKPKVTSDMVDSIRKSKVLKRPQSNIINNLTPMKKLKVKEKHQIQNRVELDVPEKEMITSTNIVSTSTMTNENHEEKLNVEILDSIPAITIKNSPLLSSNLNQASTSISVSTQQQTISITSSTISNPSLPILQVRKPQSELQLKNPVLESLLESPIKSSLITNIKNTSLPSTTTTTVTTLPSKIVNNNILTLNSRRVPTMKKITENRQTNTEISNKEDDNPKSDVLFTKRLKIETDKPAQLNANRRRSRTTSTEDNITCNKQNASTLTAQINFQSASQKKHQTLAAMLSQKIESVPTLINSLTSSSALKALSAQQPTSSIVQPQHTTSISPSIGNINMINIMDLPVNIMDESTNTGNCIDEIKSGAEVDTEHACFFSLIRDIITSTPEDRLSPIELETRVRLWSEHPAAVNNAWFSVTDGVRLGSAIDFLTGTSTDLLPEDYVPFMEYKTALDVYQWIGAGRDGDHNLVALCNIWAERGGCKVVSESILSQSCSTMTGNNIYTRRTTATDLQEGAHVSSVARGSTVQPTSFRDRSAFREQELKRYSNPHKGFVYELSDKDITVGPVKSQNVVPSKARGHTLLIQDRPKWVTILELVRDAAARLPNAAGTRSDIVTLLKDSRFLREDAQDSVLSSVVSGALDKLHTESDPPVTFDSKRKLWVYLHSNRTVEEFERYHALDLEEKRKSRPAPRAKPKPKKEQIKDEEVVTQISDTQQDTSALTSPIINQNNIISSQTKLIPESIQNLLNKTSCSNTVNRGVTSSTGTVIDVESIITPMTKSNANIRLLNNQTLTTTDLATVTATTMISSMTTSITTTASTTTTTSTSTPIQQTLTQQQQLAKSIIGAVKQASQQVTSELKKKEVLQNCHTLKKMISNTLTGDQIGNSKFTQMVKPVVKVIGAQGNIVRTLQKTPQLTQQQLIQIKQQLLSEHRLTATKKNVSSEGVPQFFLMKPNNSGNEGGGQPMIVISSNGKQEQLMVTNEKQQKQIKQLMASKQLDSSTSGPLTLQLQQLIIAKQQQGDHQKTSNNSPTKVSQQMIVIKGSGTQTSAINVNTATVSSATGVRMSTAQQSSGPQIQQMIVLNKDGSQLEDGTVTLSEIQQISPQQLQQLLLKQQQMVILKQDQKSVQNVISKGPVQQQPAQHSNNAVMQQIVTQKTTNLADRSAIIQAALQQQMKQRQIVKHTTTTGTLNTARVVTRVSPQLKQNTTATVQVVSNSSTPGITKVVSSGGPILENLMLQTQKPQTIGVGNQRATLNSAQYVAQRVVVSQTTSITQATTSVSNSSINTSFFVTDNKIKNDRMLPPLTTVKVPGLRMAQIDTKQLVLTGKVQTKQQNVVGTGTSVSTGTNQQIIIPSGTPLTIKGLKVFPVQQGSRQGIRGGSGQFFARLISPNSRQVVVQSSQFNQIANSPQTVVTTATGNQQVINNSQIQIGVLQQQSTNQPTVKTGQSVKLQTQTTGLHQVQALQQTQKNSLVTKQSQETQQIHQIQQPLQQIQIITSQPQQIVQIQEQ